MNLQITFTCDHTFSYYIGNENTLQRIPKVINYYFRDYKISQGEFTKSLKHPVNLVFSDKANLPNIYNTRLDDNECIYVGLISGPRNEIEGQVYPYLMSEEVYVFSIEGEYKPFIMKEIQYKNIYDIAINNIEEEDINKIFIKEIGDYLLIELLNRYLEGEKNLVFYYDDENGDRRKEMVGIGVTMAFAKNISIQCEWDNDCMDKIKSRLEILKKQRLAPFPCEVCDDLKFPLYPFFLKLTMYYEKIEELQGEDLQLYKMLKNREVKLVTSRWVRELPTYFYDEYYGGLIKFSERNMCFNCLMHNPYIYNMYIDYNKDLFYKNAYTFLVVV